MSALKTPVSVPPGKLNSIRSTGLSLPIDFLTQPNLKMSANAASTTWPESMSSQEAFPARTSVSPVPGTATRISAGSAANEAAFSGKSYESSRKFNPGGWCLRMSLTCSLSTIAKTLRSSSGPLRTAGMWDAGECLMLSISESPSSVAGFSWSQVIDECPPWSCWVTPRQWTQYLQRLARSPGHAQRMPGLPILSWRIKPDHRSLWAAPLSSLTRTHGIRWLSGSERLRMMGFASGWMRPTLQRLSLQETPSLRKSRSGSPTS